MMLIRWRLQMPFDNTKPINTAPASVVEVHEPSALVEISETKTVRETPSLAPFPGDRFSDAAARYWLEKFPQRANNLYSIGEVHRPEYCESPSGKASHWAADSIIFQLYFLG